MYKQIKMIIVLIAVIILGFNNCYAQQENMDKKIQNSVEEIRKDITRLMPMFSLEEIRFLEGYKGETLRVAYEENQPPLEYRNESGEAKGIAIDLFNEIAKMLNVKVEYVPIEDFEIEQMDIDLNLATVVEHQESAFLDRTEPYLNMSLVLITPKDLTENEELVGGILNYTGVNEEQIEAFFPYIDLHYFSKVEEMLKLFQEGEIDCIFVSEIGADELLKALGTNIYKMHPLNLKIALTIGMDPSLEEQFEGILNKAIRSIPSDKLISILLNNAVEQIDLTVPVLTIKQSVVFRWVGMGVFLIFGITLALIVNVTKHRTYNKMINEDTLTGVMSEYNFIQSSKTILMEAEPNDYSVIMIDIDNFKYINEVYGYVKGSLLLKVFSESLVEVLPRACLIGRIFGDRFGILIKKEHLKDLHHMHEQCSEKLHQKAKVFMSQEAQIHLSAGMYTIDSKNAEFSYIMDCANIARLKSKSVYGDCFSVFNENMYHERFLKKSIISQMETALKNKEFEIDYQPKIELHTHKLVGAEALVRWKPHYKSPLAPSDFIPVLEKNGFIYKLDYYVFEEVCAFIKSWNREERIPVISINISGYTFLREDLLPKLLGIVYKYDISPQCLEIEITETAVIENLEECIHKIQTLKGLNFTISLDDFGAGISSLNRLKDIPIDILKIDKAFLGDTERRNRSVTILENIINMAKQLEIKTVAEGVETEADIQVLKRLGCDIGQGYLFAKPLNRKEFIKYVEDKLDIRCNVIE